MINLQKRCFYCSFGLTEKNDNYTSFKLKINFKLNDDMAELQWNNTPCWLKNHAYKFSHYETIAKGLKFQKFDLGIEGQAHWQFGFENRQQNVINTLYMCSKNALLCSSKCPGIFSWCQAILSTSMHTRRWQYRVATLLKCRKISFKIKSSWNELVINILNTLGLKPVTLCHACSMLHNCN